MNDQTEGSGKFIVNIGASHFRLKQDQANRYQEKAEKPFYFWKCVNNN
jgi:hypothetical protein